MNGLFHRIGLDFGARLPIDELIGYCIEHDVRTADIRLGDTGNEFSTFSRNRNQDLARRLDKAGISLGLHTLSAVNVAEFAPYLSEAVDEYLTSYIDIADQMGAKWIVVHAGYHFTACYERRKRTALERLQRIGEYAKKRNVRLLLENMNPEPADAEVKYLAQDPEECRYYFDDLDSSVFSWSYTVNHAHMLPVGIEGFFNEMGRLGHERLGEVRVADNKGGKEEHLYPGEGTIDFNAMFDLIEGSGYDGPYTLAFGTLADMLRGRNDLVATRG